MVEGHQCHRVAAAHRRLLVGKSFQARSPNGRFKEGAAAINAKPLQRIEVHGKNLFYFFGSALTGAAADLLRTPPPAPATAAEGAAAAAAVATPRAPIAAGRTILASPDSGPTFASRRSAGAGTSRSPLTGGSPSSPSSSSSATSASSGGGGSSSDGGGGGSDVGDAGSSGSEAGAGAGAGSGGGGAAAAAGGGAEGGVVVMHVHFGMSGAFRTMSLPGPQPTETTRLELVNKEMGLVAHLSAMTVNHGSLDLYLSKAAQLGPDPLREDADKELLWSKLPRCRKPIGLVLMDQSMMAGVGNIYRAEILFKAGVHPEAPAATITREQFDRIWYHSVDLLQRGFLSGSIITVDPQEARRLGKPWTRRYIYNQKQCGRCRGPIRTWDMASRTVYCCETCQPLRLPPGSGDGGEAGGGPGQSGAAAAAGAAAALSPARLAAMAAATPTRLFRSHCAPDDPEDEGLPPAKLTVPQLRAKLTALNLDTRGNKAQLVERLETAVRWQKQQQQGGQQQEEEEQEGGQQQGQQAGAAARAVRRGTGRSVGKKQRGAAVQEGGSGRRRRRHASEAPVVEAVVLEEQEDEETEDEEEQVDLVDLVAEEKAEEARAGGSAEGAALVPQKGGVDAVGQEGVVVVSSGSEEELDRAEEALAARLSADKPAPRPDAGPGAAAAADLSRLTVPQLKSRLRELRLPISGVKQQLVDRLKAALAAPPAAAAVAAAASAATSEADGDSDTAATPSTPPPPPPPPALLAMPPPVLPPGAEAAEAASPRTPVPAAEAAMALRGPGCSAPKRPRKVGPPAPLASPPAGLRVFEQLESPTTSRRAAGDVDETPAAGSSGDGGGGSGVGKYDIQPGVRRLEEMMASAREAALEKMRAGENRAVEHVALEDDDVADLLAAAAARGRGTTGRARKRARAAAAAIEAAAAESEEGEARAG